MPVPAALTPPPRPRRRPAGLRHRPPPLTVAQILTWADKHFERTGSYPNRNSGEVYDAAGEKWHLIDTDMRQGHRGLPGGDSLARLLARERGVSTFRGEQVSVQVEGSSPSSELWAAGERIGPLPARLDVLRASLRVLVPESSSIRRAPDVT